MLLVFQSRRTHFVLETGQVATASFLRKPGSFSMTEALRPASLPLRQPQSPAAPPRPALPLSCLLPLRLPRRSGLVKTRPFSVSICAKWRRAAAVAATIWGGVEEGPLSGDAVEEGDDAPTSVELVPIGSEEQFDRIIVEAQQLEELIVVLWMANWCRKCIYLKPKLEKLAADYYPRVRFYCVDVNSVSQRLVNRAGITKMPTIQMWKDSERQAEVIGGHKSWLVIDDVRRMIENEEQSGA